MCDCLTRPRDWHRNSFPFARHRRGAIQFQRLTAIFRAGPLIRRMRPRHTAAGEPDIPSLGKTMVTTWPDFLATLPRIKRAVGPLDLAVLDHHTARTVEL